MNYNKIYSDLIIRAQNRKIDEYTESHHIVPRCMGGSDAKTNLVDLTPEEHYVAHQLLVKIYPANMAILSAAVMMIPNRPSNKLYGWLRKKHSKNMSESQSGDKNSQFGTKWIHSPTERKSKKIGKNEAIPEGWLLGRDKDPIIFDNCIVCSKEKDPRRKFCSNSCAASHNNSIRSTIFDEHLDSMIIEYKNGMSIHKCLVSRGLCGTGKNFTTLKKLLESVGG